MFEPIDSSFIKPLNGPPNYDPPLPPDGKVDLVSQKMGLRTSLLTSDPVLVEQSPLPTSESEAIKDANLQSRKTKRSFIKKLLAIFHKKKTEKKVTNIFTRFLRCFKKTKKEVAVQAVGPFEKQRSNISVESYHRLVKELIGLIDKTPAYEQSSATPSIFRGNAPAADMIEFEKAFYSDPGVEVPAKIRNNIDSMAGLVKRIVFMDMDSERFRALRLDSVFKEDLKSPDEIIAHLHDKLSALNAQDKAFLNDLITLIEMAYRKSWQQRPNACIETMLISVPTVGRFFNGDLALDSNPLNPTALVTTEVQKLILFMIDYQEAIFNSRTFD